MCPQDVLFGTSQPFSACEYPAYIGAHRIEAPETQI